MSESRICEQCGRAFEPRREHARFCSVGCRVTWNQDKLGDPGTTASALLWSITAMSETTRRLAGLRTRTQPDASALLGEAVWWVTMVDATMVRHYLDVYDGVVAGQAEAERRLVDGTLAGLRFVRNRIARTADPGEFIHLGTAGSWRGTSSAPGWIWRPARPPADGSLGPRARHWEMTRHGAYQRWLAGHAVEETFRPVTRFLTLAAANITAITGIHPGAGPRNTPPLRSATGE